jgi:hypothetical protein
MIVINIQGGLGNQLFQYSFGYSIAKDLHTTFMFDYTHSFIVPAFFRVNRLYMWLNNYKYLSKLNRKIYEHIKSNQNLDFTDCRLTSKDLIRKNNAYYDGFFQSVDFFISHEYDIIKRLNVRLKYQKQFRNEYKEILDKSKILVIHIRRTDYLSHGIGKNLGQDDLSLPFDFYKKSLSLIENLEQYKIFVIGDDIEFSRINFSYLENVCFPNNHIIIDFQLIMNADIAIISNSTFSWWAAYLNQKKNKRIIAPKNFLGFHIYKEFPNGISKDTPFEWIDVVK